VPKFPVSVGPKEEHDGDGETLRTTFLKELWMSRGLVQVFCLFSSGLLVLSVELGTRWNRTSA
jgi:hypothetical protein